MRTGLYRIYDSKTRLLYVGISENPKGRLRKHRSSSPWRGFAVAHSLQSFEKRGPAESAEFRAIEGEGPLFNGDHGECFQGSAEDARKAIPVDLPRLSLGWNLVAPREAPKPYRIRYQEFSGRVENLKFGEARRIADKVMANHADQADNLKAEWAGVLHPWGLHAVVAYSVRFGLLTLAELDALRD